jgi:hypothetical protein
MLCSSVCAYIGDLRPIEIIIIKQYNLFHAAHTITHISVISTLFVLRCFHRHFLPSILVAYYSGEYELLVAHCGQLVFARGGVLALAERRLYRTRRSAARLSSLHIR